MKKWIDDPLICEFHQYTATTILDPDIVAYGRAGWELVTVLQKDIHSADTRYTFFLQRKYKEASDQAIVNKSVLLK